MSQRTSGRQIKPSLKVIEQKETEEEQLKQITHYKRPKHAEPRQPRQPPRPQPRQPPQPQQALPAIVLPDQEIEEVNDENMTKEELADFYVDDNPFYKKHFYTPKDFITKRYDEVDTVLSQKYDEKFDERLPVFISNGIMNLAVKPNLIEQPKKKVLFSKLSQGEYETKGSKSDKTNITSSIKFFRNKLPSFEEYKDEDDLNYIIHSRRLLVVELLEYYSTKTKWRLATLKSRFVAIIRIYRLAYGNKDYIEYEFLSLIIQMLGLEIDEGEGNNKITDEEASKFLAFKIILDKQKEIDDKFTRIQNKKTQTAYDLNQDLTLLSLYTLIPPLRNEIKTLNFTKTSKTKGDYIYIKPNGEIILLLNEEKKRHDAISFNLTKESPRLASILQESYTLYPRENVFTAKKKYPDT